MNRFDVASGSVVIKKGPKRPTMMNKPTIALPRAALRLTVKARQVLSRKRSMRAYSGSLGRSASGAALAEPGISWVFIAMHPFLRAHEDRGTHTAYRL